MAMPYPEGEVFFKRSALKIAKGSGKDSWSFNPDIAKDFASHILIEYIYNRPCGAGGPRSYSCNAEVGSYKGYYPDSFSVMFSNTTEKLPPNRANVRGIPMLKQVKIDTLNDAIAYRDRHSGGPDKVTIMPVPVTAGAKYMFIDLFVPIRAIYLPLAQKVDKIHPDLCTYIMVDFRFRKGEYMIVDGMSKYEKPAAGYSQAAIDAQYEAMRGNSSKAAASPKKPDLKDAKDISDYKAFDEKQTDTPYTWQKFSYTEGLGLMPQRTLQMDLRGVYNLLILPRQLRNSDKGLYHPRNAEDALIKICEDDIHTVHNETPPQTIRAFQLLDYAGVISDHFGVDVTWQPYEYVPETASLISEIFKVGAETGLSLIPGVGPLASAGFSVFMEAISDPEGFKANNILKLDGEVLKGVLESAGEAAKYLAKRKGTKGASVIKILV